MHRSLPSFAVAMAAVLALGVAAPASAQELMASGSLSKATLFPVAPAAPAAAASTTAADDNKADKADSDGGPTFVRARFTPRPPSRPAVLPALYASQIALQALDAHSTYSALGRGGYEANPLMKDVVKSKGTMMAVKAGVAASTIWIAERMWRRGNRAGAIATMLLVNGATAAVVAHNYRVASGLH